MADHKMQAVRSRHGIVSDRPVNDFVRPVAAPTGPFLMLYMGPRPENPTHEGWPEWFNAIGGALIDAGSPMRNGFILRSDRSTSNVPSAPLGYGIVEAEDRVRAIDLLRDHPLWRSGDEYAIEVFELPRR